MIQPLSLTSDTFTLEPLPYSAREGLDDKTATGDRFTLDSGPYAGAPVALVRVTPSADTDPLQWQVIDLDQTQHGGLFHTYEAALHCVMALAYRLAARRMEAESATAIRERERAERGPIPAPPLARSRHADQPTHTQDNAQ